MMFVSSLLSDLEVLHFFNGSDNLFIDQLALVLTSGLTWIPGAVVCVALSEGITDGVVKPLVERWRPNNDPILKYSIQVVGNLRGSGYSFFSAHAANTMSIAMFFSLLMRGRRLAIALFSWSLLNCWTRLYLGMHYPSDILCGLLVGAVLGFVCYIGYLKLYYKVSPHITYISDQYTPTGYDHDDIDKILCILAFTLVYAYLRAIVMAGGV